MYSEAQNLSRRVFFLPCRQRCSVKSSDPDRTEIYYGNATIGRKCAFGAKTELDLARSVVAEAGQIQRTQQRSQHKRKLSRDRAESEPTPDRIFSAVQEAAAQSIFMQNPSESKKGSTAPRKHMFRNSVFFSLKWEFLECFVDLKWEIFGRFSSACSLRSQKTP